MTPVEPRRALASLAQASTPRRRIVSVSDAEPQRFNVVAATEDESVARRAVLQLEVQEIDHARIGLVALGRPDATERRDVDPEGVSRWLAPRTGGLLGALAGALVGAAVAVLVGATAAIVVAAALAGAALLAVPGTIWLTFPRVGGSGAYRQTIVARDVDALSAMSLHTSSREEAERATDRLAAAHGLEVWVFDADGRQVRRAPTR